MNKNYLRRLIPRVVNITFILIILLGSIIFSSPVYAANERYFVMGQTFWADGTADCNIGGRIIADTAFTVVAAGNFTVTMANGTAGTVSGTNIAGSPVTLSAGANTITASDAVADGSFDITIGTAANWNTVNSWSAASGGAAGATVPEATNSVYFNANSFTAGSQIATLDATGTCLDMDWTGATNNPTLAFTNRTLNCNGSATFIAAMTTTISTAEGNITFAGTGTGRTLTTNGLTLACEIKFNNGAVTLADNLTLGSNRDLYFLGTATLNTNGKTVTVDEFIISGTDAKVLTLGASTVNLTAGWNCTGSNLTLTANTSTINIAGTGAFAGNGITTYNIVNLNGSAHTISGNNTLNTLALPAGTTQTITFTDGSTQTASTFTLSGSAGHVHTLQGSGTAGWALSDASGTNNYDYISVSYSTAGGGATFNANGVSVNGGNNSGWVFPLTVTSSAITNLSLGKVTFNGTLVNLGGVGSGANSTVSFEWGYVPGFGNTSSTQVLTAPGAYSVNVTNVNPSQIVYYRAKVTNTSGTGYSTTGTFILSTTAAQSVSLAQILFPIIMIVIVMLFMLAGTNSGMSVEVMVIILVVIVMLVAFLGALTSTFTSLLGG